jgi:hypothetical protein
VAGEIRPGPAAIERAAGVNETEQRLKALCDRAFLTPWSYPNVYKGPGQELCDALVVSGDDVIIFSVKAGSFNHDGDLGTAWNRWFRRTIEESLRQVRGAERWIKNYPDRLYVDRFCAQPFPLPIPDPTVARYHRILIAHGATEREQIDVGRARSLAIVPAIEGPMHYASPADGGEPFAVGVLDPDFGFVHVFDKASVDALLTELDTTFDLLTYLRWKERFIEGGHLERAASEPDLLAFYLERVREANEYEPPLPDQVGRLTVEAGLWKHYERSPHRASRQDANASSYVIDRLIEQFSRNAYSRSEHSASKPGVAGLASILRFLAREPRTRRRFIGRALESLLAETPVTHFAAVTVIHPTRAGEPLYVLLLVSPRHPHSPGNYEDYLEFRLWMLGEYCRAARYQFPHAEDVVGIATDLTSGTGRSEVAVHYDGRNFTEQDASNARDLIAQTGAFQNLRHFVGVESYFASEE